MSYTSLMNYAVSGMQVARTLLGFPVVESRVVPHGQAYLVDGRVITGDPGHFVHRIRMDLIKREMRRDLEKMLDEFAARVGVSR